MSMSKFALLSPVLFRRKSPADVDKNLFEIIGDALVNYKILQSLKLPVRQLFSGHLWTLLDILPISDSRMI